MEGFLLRLEEEGPHDSPPAMGPVLRGKRGSSLRRKREFMPDEKKDDMYWEKRRKNNEAAKRSREKRRMNDFAVESKLMALNEENAFLKVELLALKFRCGLITAAAYSQQAHAIRTALELYYSRYKQSIAEHTPQSREPVSPETGLYTPSSFAYRPTSEDTSLIKGLSMEGTFYYADKDMGKRKLTNMDANFGKVAYQPKEHQSAFRSVQPAGFRSYPYCYPSVYGTRVSIPKPILAQVNRCKHLKSLLDDAVAEHAPISDALLPSDSPPCPAEGCPQSRSCSALPHKLRIKAKALGATVENMPDSLAAATEKVATKERPHTQKI
ncbi:nuclear factor interleukin-3-regulated protein-like [Ambystoma mexicanum]|uniref:nuclear factor interleukin-3-regulated protein-like n=1 Tax=Ambystoma mexicanum TaxID=8296 RepID=UPI0037E8D958